MDDSGWQKITVIGMKHLPFFTDEHFDGTGEDQSALIEGMLMSGVFGTGGYFHDDHHQILADFSLALDIWAKG